MLGELLSFWAWALPSQPHGMAQHHRQHSSGSTGLAQQAWSLGRRPWWEGRVSFSCHASSESLDHRMWGYWMAASPPPFLPGSPCLRCWQAGIPLMGCHNRSPIPLDLLVLETSSGPLSRPCK